MDFKELSTGFTLEPGTLNPFATTKVTNTHKNEIDCMMMNDYLKVNELILSARFFFNVLNNDI